MIETVGGLLAALSALIGLAVMAGLTWARFRTSADDATKDIWRGEAEAQKARGDRLEVTVNSLVTRVDNLERENGLLRELVTGRQEIVELRAEFRTGVDEIKALIAGGVK